MKLLALLLVATASGVAVVAAALALSGGGHSAKAASVQYLTMRVQPGDHMLGQQLIVRPGRVVLTILNSARHAHTFTVPHLGIDRVLLPGTPSAPSVTTLRFRVGAEGAYGWFCKLPCETTMNGTIYVLKNPPRMHDAAWAQA